MARKRLSARDLRARRAHELTRALEEELRLTETFARKAKSTLRELKTLLAQMDVPEGEKRGPRRPPKRVPKTLPERVPERVKKG